MLFDEKDIDNLFHPAKKLSEEERLFSGAKNHEDWWKTASVSANDNIPPTLESIPSQQPLEPRNQPQETTVFVVRPKKQISRLALTTMAVLFTYLVLNGPALYKNFKWWYITDYQNKSVSDGQPQALADSDLLYIQKLGVSAPIIWNTTNANRPEALKEGVAALTITYPGEGGVITLVGQASDYWWENSKYGQVFSLLQHLVIGDRAIINYKAKNYNYIVTHILNAAPTKDLLTGGDTLVLISSSPLGNTKNRIYVIAKLDIGSTNP